MAADATICLYVSLVFDDLQDLHGTSLCTDAAGDALGSRAAFLQNHNLHGASLNALTTGNTQLLVDHVDTGLGILSDGTSLTGLHALAALDADHGLGIASLIGTNLNAAESDIKFLIECLRAGLYALQTCHALLILLNGKLFHKTFYPFYYL